MSIINKKNFVNNSSKRNCLYNKFINIKIKKLKLTLKENIQKFQQIYYNLKICHLIFKNI